jgi:hypothetical protein
VVHGALQEKLHGTALTFLRWMPSDLIWRKGLSSYCCVAAYSPHFLMGVNPGNLALQEDST